MRRWGIIISVFYAIVLLGLLWPLAGYLIEEKFADNFLKSWKILIEPDEIWPVYVWALLLTGGQILLLFLTVDTSWRRRKRRCHLAITIAFSTFLFSLLCLAAYMSILDTLSQEARKPFLTESLVVFFTIWLALWVIWAAVFYSYYRNNSVYVDKVVSWLLKASVLELLIAVTAHVVARQRTECSHPAGTSFGIVTGLAIMLMCFGPGVLALHKKRVAAYSKPGSAAIPAKAVSLAGTVGILIKKPGLQSYSIGGICFCLVVAVLLVWWQFWESTFNPTPIDTATTKTLGVHPKPVKAVAFSTSGNTVYSTDGGSHVLSWNVKSALPVSRGSSLQGVQTLTISSNGKVALASSRNSLVVVKLMNRQILNRFNTGLNAATAFPAYAHVSPDASKALIVDFGGNLSLWDLIKGRALHPLMGRNSTLVNAGRDASAFSPKGSVVLIASSKRPSLEIRDVASGDLLQTIFIHDQGTRATAFSTDGKRIATVGMDNGLKLWDVKSGKLLNSYDTSVVPVINRVVIASYRNLLITGHANGLISVWHHQTGKILKQFEAHNNWVEAMAVSTNGSGLVSGGPNGKVKYWNLAHIVKP